MREIKARFDHPKCGYPECVCTISQEEYQQFIIWSAKNCGLPFTSVEKSWPLIQDRMALYACYPFEFLKDLRTFRKLHPELVSAQVESEHQKTYEQLTEKLNEHYGVKNSDTKIKK